MSAAYKVGEYGYICVGIGGNVTAIRDGVVEIEGVEMPLSLSAGPEVRYISSEPPPDPDGEVECPWCDDNSLRVDDVTTRWEDLIRFEHEDFHEDAWVLCANRLCMEVQGR